MIEAFCAVMTFAIGVLLGLLITKRFVGERMWRDGYMYGFNLAWDEKSKSDEAARQKHLKDIRKKRPKLTLVGGEGR